MKTNKTNNTVYTSSTDLSFRCACILLCLLALSSSSALRAQDFISDSYSIDGAGGQSSGGDFELSGSVSQPDASDLSGGDFELSAGFWGTIAVTQTGPPPGLSVRLQQTDVLISWPQAGSDGFVLESTSDLSGGRGGPIWTRVDVPPQSAGGVLTVSLPLASGNQFYRLHQF